MKQAASGIAADRDGAPIWLGLIGDTIAASESPLLHWLAGRQAGRTVIYERLCRATLGSVPTICSSAG
jgi:shikimate 5-dehydrogenase